MLLIPKQLPRALTSSYVDEKRVERMEALPSVCVCVCTCFFFVFFKPCAASWENISLFTLVDTSNIYDHVDIRSEGAVTLTDNPSVNCSVLQRRL